LSWAYYNRGIARAASGDLKGAIADYSQTIDFDPRDASAYLNRGLARLMLHQEKEAKKDLDTCLKLDARLKPQLDEAIRHLEARQTGGR